MISVVDPATEEVVTEVANGTVAEALARLIVLGNGKCRASPQICLPRAVLRPASATGTALVGAIHRRWAVRQGGPARSRPSIVKQWQLVRGVNSDRRNETTSATHHHDTLAVLDRAPHDFALVGVRREAEDADGSTVDRGAERREFALRASTGGTDQKVRRRNAGLVACARPVLHPNRLSLEGRVGRVDDIAYADHDVRTVGVQGGTAAQPVREIQAAAVEPLDVGLRPRRQDNDVGIQPQTGVQVDAADLACVHVKGFDPSA